MNATHTMIDTPQHIEAYGLLALKARLKLESKGMRVSRGPSALAIVRSKHGVKARTAAKALTEFEAMLREKGILK